MIHETLDTPEFGLDDHCVLVHVSGPVTVVRRIRGVSREVVAAPGTICLISAGAPRQFRAREPHEVVVLALSRRLLERAAEPSYARGLELRDKHELRDRRVEQIVRALELEVRDGCPSGALYGESLGLALSLYLLQKYSLGSATPRRNAGGMAPKALERVIEHIHEHLADDLRLSALADVAGLSEHRFAHNFKKTTGVSPHRYVMGERIERAKRMLRDTDRTVGEIACDLGFSSPSRFSSVFGQWTGTTPSSYKRRAR
jgi:AraC family transcriptional regulator